MRFTRRLAHRERHLIPGSKFYPTIVKIMLRGYFRLYVKYDTKATNSPPSAPSKCLITSQCICAVPVSFLDGRAEAARVRCALRDHINILCRSIVLHIHLYKGISLLPLFEAIDPVVHIHQCKLNESLLCSGAPLFVHSQSPNSTSKSALFILLIYHVIYNQMRVYHCQ